MSNLISLLTALSKQFLRSDSENINKPLNKKSNTENVKLVRQKGFNVIHQYREDEHEASSEWYPEILITDYAYELLQKGAESSSNVLFESIGVLEESGYDFEEILTFLLHLKGPFSESPSVRQHPFSLSGSDYFLRPTSPFKLLPKELTCGVIESGINREPSPEILFLDNFINIPKKQEIVRSLPKLQDLVENELPKPKQEKRNQTPPKPRPISPWSDFERDILDGAEFSEDELKKPFLEDYEAKLNASGQNPFATKNKPNDLKKRKGLGLSMYLEDEHLKSLIEPSLAKVAYQEVDLQDYIDQVKYLMLGVDGRIFKYDATEKKYFMKVGVYVDGLPPDCLFEVSRPFLECGTFFKNLWLAVEEEIFSNSGVIYPTFWSSVSKFLQDYSQAVVNLPSQDSLMLLKMSTSKMCLDLSAVYRLCFPKNGALPSDGHLISYLFEYCAYMQHQSVLFAIIYDCCAVYFSKLLEKWMFQGLLDISYLRDFFISENKDVISGRDRSLYCSVIINEESVPSVLRSLALKIFSCGKAMWLLKMCDPGNKFIFFTETKKLPKLRICFTDKDFSEMELEYKNYEKAIQLVCGEIVTFTTLREAEEREKLKLIQSPKPIEVPYNNISQKQDIIENEKKLTTEYYNKLSREAENIKNISDWRSKRMELHDRRVEFLKDDLINENTVFDEEGNVIAPTEADMENANVVLGKNLCNSPQKAKTDNEALQNKTKILGTTLFDDSSFRTKPMTTEASRNKMKIMGTDQGNQEHTEIILTEAMKNKMKIMGNDNSEPVVKNLNSTPLTEAMKNKLKILGTEYEQFENVTEKINRPLQPLTEAMKNKLKVLGTEYNCIPENEYFNNQLTDAMKNKNKILGTEIGDELPASTQPCEKIITEAMRNKMKILGRDYERETIVVKKNSNDLTDAQKNKLKVLGTDFDLPVPKNTPQPVIDKKIEDSRTSVKEEESISEPPKLKVNLFEAKTSQPSLLDSNDDRPKPDFEEMDASTFARSIQRSLLIALNVQERLANSSVLQHFLVKENFMTHLTSLRCFYLLHDGEFSRSLTYGLFQSLVQSSEPLHFFDPGSLSGILNEALNSANQGYQTNPQNVSFQILKIPKKLEKESHDVLSPFQLSYKVSWPINIVVTPQVLSRYRQVFHVLVNLKRVHWMLNETFLLLKSQTKDQILDGKLLMKSPEYTKLATYRHAMTLFIMTLEEHLSGNGLQEAWSNFMKQLETVNDLDHLYQKHVEFVKDVRRRCFLSRSSLLLSYINELVELALSFHSIVSSAPWRLINDKQYSHPKFADLKVIFNKFCKVTKVFSKALSKKSKSGEYVIHAPLLELINLKIKF